MKDRYGLLLLAALLVLPLSLSQAAEQKEKQKRGWLGVTIQSVTEKIQKREKLPSDEGAFITDITDESPADSIGFKRGDVIVSFGGKAVYEPDDLSRFVSRTVPGTKVEIVYYRDGAKKTASVVIGKQPRSHASSFAFAMPSFPKIEVFMGGATLGITARSLNEQLAAYFGAPNNEGVLVEEVEKGKAGDKAGLAAGDVIIRAGKRSVAEVDDISKELRKLDEGDKVEVEVIRKGTKKTVSVEVMEIEEGPEHLRNLERRIRVRPHGEVFEWNSDDDAEDDEGEFRIQRDKIRSVAPHIMPGFAPHVAGSVTI